MRRSHDLALAGGEYTTYRAGPLWSGAPTGLVPTGANLCNAQLPDENKKIHEIRLTGQPEVVHRDIYDKLNIKINPDRQMKVVGKRL